MRIRPWRLPTALLKDGAIVVVGAFDAVYWTEEVAGYALAAGIEVVWMADGDHSFKPRAASGRTERQNLEAAVAAVLGFVSRLR